MAFLEKHLVVKKSSIPGSGKGLFTKVFIPKDTRVVEYKGRITKWSEVKNDSENGYMYTINRSYVIDARPFTKALGRYANDARGLVRVKGLTNNCIYLTEGTKAFIESVKDIPAGAEILVDYGKEYWDVIRQNLKIDREKKKKEAKKAVLKKKEPKKSVPKKKKKGVVRLRR